MIKKATRADIPRIVEIRSAVRENRLGDLTRVTTADLEWFIDNPGFWLWIEDGNAQGFSAGDPRDGYIFALFIDPQYEGRGIGQALLPFACDALKAAGYKLATLDTEPNTRAERFYRRGGWLEIGRKDDGQITFQKAL